MADYPGTYIDKRGPEPAIIHFDRRSIDFTAAGVLFQDTGGTYQPECAPEDPALQRFTLAARTYGRLALDEQGRYRLGEDYQVDELIAFSLEWEMPVDVVLGKEVVTGTIKTFMRFFDPDRDKLVPLYPGSTRETPIPGYPLDIIATLRYGDGICLEADGGGLFESTMEILTKALPSGAGIRTCFFCAYGDYSPSGQDVYGSMLCFRNLKAEYDAIAMKGNKSLFLDLGSDERVESTGELYCCPEFELVVGGRGYRSSGDV